MCFSLQTFVGVLTAPCNGAFDCIDLALLLWTSWDIPMEGTGPLSDNMCRSRSVIEREVRQLCPKLDFQNR